jgi:hypothetical protein
MKFWVLMLVLAISVQPAQAGFCDMDMAKNPNTAHHADSASTSQDDHGGHPCCGSDDPGTSGECDGGMQCGFCHGGVSPLPSVIRFAVEWPYFHAPKLSSGVVLPSHASPPFRPPIS